MKKLNLLKTTLDFFWIFAMIAIFTTIFFIPFELFGEPTVPLKIKGFEIDPEDLPSKAVIAIYVICQMLFIYSIYLLRNIVKFFRQMDIFNIEVIRNFNLMGKLIVYSSLISNITLFAYKFYLRQHESFAINLDTYTGFDSFLISVSLGLFFMVISEVFKIAKSAKEENELTV